MNSEKKHRVNSGTSNLAGSAKRHHSGIYKALSPSGLKNTGNDASIYDDKGKSLNQGHKKQKESMTGSFR